MRRDGNGSIYFSVLAGETLASLLGIHAPLWTGFWSDGGDHPASPRSLQLKIDPGSSGDPMARREVTRIAAPPGAKLEVIDS